MFDRKTVKLMESCLKLHYAINPHLILREGRIRHLILEKADLSDALDTSREKLTATLSQVEEVYKIIDGLFKKAMENKGNAELIPDSNVLDGYFEALRKSIDDNQNKLNQLQSLGTKLDSPKNYKAIKSISTKALENQGALQGLSKSITAYMEEMTTALAKQGDDKMTVLSTLSPEAVKSTLKSVSTQLRSGYRGKEQNVIGAWLSRMGAGETGKLNPNPLFNELAKVLMLVPLKDVTQAATNLNAAEGKIEKTTNDVAKATKGVTDAVEAGADAGKPDATGAEAGKPDATGAEAGKPDATGAEAGKPDATGAEAGKPDATAETPTSSSDYIGKVIDAWSSKVDTEKTFGAADIKNKIVNALKASTPEIKNAIEKNKQVFTDFIKDEVKSSINDYLRKNPSLQSDLPSARKTPEFESAMEKLNAEITDAIIQLKLENNNNITRSKIGRMVQALLDHRFKNSKLIKETNSLNENKKSVSNSVDLKRINKLAGLED
jgi:hypothetical protein